MFSSLKKLMDLQPSKTLIWKSISGIQVELECKLGMCLKWILMNYPNERVGCWFTLAKNLIQIKIESNLHLDFSTLICHMKYIQYTAWKFISLFTTIHIPKIIISQLYIRQSNPTRPIWPWNWTQPSNLSNTITLICTGIDQGQFSPPELTPKIS